MCCILTPYDSKVQYQLCRDCGVRCHVMCQQADTVDAGGEVEFNVDFVCRACRDTATYEALEEKVKADLEMLSTASKEVSRQVVVAKNTFAAKEGEVQEEQGARRKMLARKLQDELGVNKCEYFSGTYVGRHCDKMIANIELLREVLDGAEEQEGIMEFALTYKKAHFLMKARRELEDDELDTLEATCHKLGEIYPRVFRGSITPKLHELCWYVPQLARRWRTVGGMREEGIEAAHNVVNRLERVLCCVRREDERMAIAMTRMALRQQQQASTFATPEPRKFVKPRK